MSIRQKQTVRMPDNFVIAALHPLERNFQDTLKFIASASVRTFRISGIQPLRKISKSLGRTAWLQLLTWETLTGSGMTLRKFSIYFYSKGAQ
jgi:hypothetical protein